MKVYVFSSDRVESNAVISWEDFQELMKIVDGKIQFDLLVHRPTV